MSESPLLDASLNNGDAVSSQNRLGVRRVRLEEIYFKEHICDEFLHSRYPIPDQIRRSRNRAI